VGRIEEVPPLVLAQMVSGFNTILIIIWVLVILVIGYLAYVRG
jgi:hypothetical protein